VEISAVAADGGDAVVLPIAETIKHGLWRTWPGLASTVDAMYPTRFDDPRKYGKGRLSCCSEPKESRDLGGNDRPVASRWHDLIRNK
jgi:hypothetical protein